MSRAWIIILMIAVCRPLFGQSTTDQDLARGLASDARQATVAEVVSSGGAKVGLLLSWTQTPPPHVKRDRLYVGLADVFGQLKTKEAIPFLIKNITLQRWLEANTWLKSAEVIEERLPAVAALVLIGPEASKALIRASWGPMTSEERLATIFAVSRIQDPEARDFLVSALAQANLEGIWAQQGLKVLGKERQ
jgi:hypothetical protein